MTGNFTRDATATGGLSAAPASTRTARTISRTTTSSPHSRDSTSSSPVTTDSETSLGPTWTASIPSAILPRSWPPSPSSCDQEGVTVSAANIYNPFGRDFSAVRRRLVEFGDRTSQQDIHNFRFVTGIDGTTPGGMGPLAGWFWDFAFSFGQNESTELKRGNLRLPVASDAVGPSFMDPADRSGPLRHRHGPHRRLRAAEPVRWPGSIQPDQMHGLTFSGVQRGDNRMMGGQFNTSGDLFRLFASRPVGSGPRLRVPAPARGADPRTHHSRRRGQRQQGTHHRGRLLRQRGLRRGGHPASSITAGRARGSR